MEKKITIRQINCRLHLQAENKFYFDRLNRVKERIKHS